METKNQHQQKGKWCTYRVENYLNIAESAVQRKSMHFHVLKICCFFPQTNLRYSYTK